MSRALLALAALLLALGAFADRWAGPVARAEPDNPAPARIADRDSR